MLAGCQLDHIVVAAASLDDGNAFVRERLGIMPLPGGAHLRMGTHNHLLRLGDDVYLEVIAVNPAGSRPGRPRWFGLDDRDQNEMLRRCGPGLATWAVRTSDIETVASRSPVAPGPVEAMSRGDLEWRITIPLDGIPPEGGTMPTIIQWPTDRPHPTANMPDFGYRLVGLDLFHSEPERLSRALEDIGLEHGDIPVTVRAGMGRPSLSARIAIPTGEAIMIGGRTDHENCKANKKGHGRCYRPWPFAYGRPDRIRTCDPQTPSLMRYQAALPAVMPSIQKWRPDDKVFRIRFTFQPQRPDRQGRRAGVRYGARTIATTSARCNSF
jgi:hypothetical protein